MTFPRDGLRRCERHYEMLRREALSQRRGLERGHGLALFLSRGMVAWMRALSALQPPPAAPLQAHPPRSPAPPRVPGSMRGELTSLLAGMVLACGQESSHE